MRTIIEVIIHCSDAENSNAETIRKWHLERGFNDIGYHYVILKNGDIETGRGIELVGAHCSGHNTLSIGVCLEGRGRQDFTPWQYYQLARIVKSIRTLFTTKCYIRCVPHNEYNKNKTCPNFDVSYLNFG